MNTAVATPLPKVRFSAAFGFALVHLAALGVFWIGFSWTGVALCLGSYYLRMFGVTAGFHRYFSHRTFELNRFWQFLLAFLAETSAQKGVLWWASNHRHHHRYSDMPEDLHSPIQRGFWWSHMGWILASDYHKTEVSRVPDLEKYPELRWLERNQYAPTMLYAIALTATFGWTGLFWGYFLSTVLLWHGTFSINSVMHVFGRRVYSTSDDSRNSMIFALVTMGEGWHNNHHYYPGAAAQGFRWWQIDVSYYLLWIGEKLGIVKKLRRVPERVVAAARVGVPAGAGRFDSAFNSIRATADATSDALHVKIEQLSVRWESIQSSVRHATDHALADLEMRRRHATEKLEKLQTEYAAATKRASDAAEKKMRELAAEIERARLQLVEILETLVATAESMAVVPA